MKIALAQQGDSKKCARMPILTVPENQFTCIYEESMNMMLPVIRVALYGYITDG